MSSNEDSDHDEASSRKPNSNSDEANEAPTQSSSSTITNIETKFVITVTKNQFNKSTIKSIRNMDDGGGGEQEQPQQAIQETTNKKRRLLTTCDGDSQHSDDLTSAHLTVESDTNAKLEPDLVEFENESKRIKADVMSSSITTTSQPPASTADDDDDELDGVLLHDDCIKRFELMRSPKPDITAPRRPLKPQTSSFSFHDFLNRDIGLIRPDKFQEKLTNSVNYLKRMKLSTSLEFHDGCVNALNFNRIGTLLASSSDDCQVSIWDWACNRSIISFDSGHKSNVFQCKFMPFTSDSQIVTSARDGQVRWSFLSGSGTHLFSKRVAKHADACHTIATEFDSPNIFLSCGEDGNVYEVDLRQETPAKIVQVRSTHDGKVPLYSISSNPINAHEFMVVGRDQYLRFYDKRMLVQEKSKILKKYTPKHLESSDKESITSAVYNYNGTEVIASYSDEDIYLFDNTIKTDTTDFVHRYKGHRNSETIKGVNYYGATSDFIVSGSDCGNIFFWDKTTENIVQCLKGDERGVVNVLEPHPSFPILATSGLDSEVKIWTPTATEPNDLKELPEIIKENQRQRECGRNLSLSTFEFELLLLLMHRPHNRALNRTYTLNLRRRRRSPHTERDANEDSDENDDDDDSYGEDDGFRNYMNLDELYDAYDEDDDDADENDDDDADDMSDNDEDDDGHTDAENDYDVYDEDERTRDSSFNVVLINEISSTTTTTTDTANNTSSDNASSNVNNNESVQESN